MSIDWGNEQQDAAFAEGWGIFDSDVFGIEIERDDEAEIFVSDVDAIEHVEKMAAQGSALHQAALDYVAQEQEST